MSTTPTLGHHPAPHHENDDSQRPATPVPAPTPAPTLPTDATLDEWAADATWAERDLDDDEED